MANNPLNNRPLPWHEAQFGHLLGLRAVLPHALLLRGPRGIGKLAFARALARALLCEKPQGDGFFCGQCSACLWFDQGTHPDYRQVEPADEGTAGEETEGEGSDRKSVWIKIEAIRELAEFINVTSHRGGAKVVVIHPVEALYPNAANALLKSLEEPPQRTHFLLVSHRPHQLLPTIKSRCQQVPVEAPDAPVAIAWLRAQGVPNADLAFAHTGGAPLLAAELADGGYWGARTAFLRQLCTPDIDVLTAAEAARDFPAPQVIAWLQKWSYDLAYCRATGRVRYNPDYAEALARLAVRIEPLAALRFHREMVNLQRIANHPLNPRLFLEDLLLAYCDLVAPQRAAA